MNHSLAFCILLVIIDTIELSSFYEHLVTGTSRRTLDLLDSPV
jgi:hypothetical protein